MAEPICNQMHSLAVNRHMGVALITHNVADSDDEAFNVPNFYYEHNEWLKES